MDYTTLGRTGLRVSVMGMGGGGPSQLGKRTGKSEADSVALLHYALDAGVNFIDTAEAYGTEEIVGKAIGGRPRAGIVISTKKSVNDTTTPAEIIAGVEASLRRLNTDYIDIYNLHGVRPEHYQYLYETVVPTFQDLQQAGKIRFIGITELFNNDLQHAMLQQALHHDVWDVLMVGFNILNQTAREQIFAQSMAKNIGVQIMFAVRRALSDPERLRVELQTLIDKGEIDPSAVDLANPLSFVLGDGGATSLTDAAYRFCRDEPGTHVILSGTGNLAHLQENIASLKRPPLPAATTAKLRQIFARATSVSGQ